jgi:preprotein translocase subunit SecD
LSDSHNQADHLSIEFRIAQDSAAPDHFAALVPELRDSIYVSNHVEISDAQIDSVNPQVMDRGLLLSIWFAPEGEKQLAKVTSANIGRRLAVCIGNDVMSAAEIVQGLDPKKNPVQVSLMLPRDSAEFLAGRLK